jgi:protocatechuate 3,4-dioxygenase beta subunit
MNKTFYPSVPNTVQLAPVIEEGLHADLSRVAATMTARRQVLGWLAAGLAPIAGCGGGSSTTSTANGAGSGAQTGGQVANNAGNTNSTGSVGSNGSCSVIPTETAGPFPGDGTNTVGGSTVNALALSGIQRSVITSSFAGSTGIAAGVALKVVLNLKSAANACGALSGYAIYLWHCDALGRYSLYSSGVTGENYLRGLQVTDANGQVSFSTIVPGCYSGRWPHIHFEVFASLAAASRGSNSAKISQLALPQNMAAEVYAGSGYPGSTGNLNATSLASDNVFSDGSSLQVASITGSLATGFVATLDLAV